MTKRITISAEDTFKGSAKKVIEVAKAQGWDLLVEQEFTDVGSLIATAITATWPGEPVVGKVTALSATFNPETGGFFTATVDVLSTMGNIQKLYGWRRDPKLKDVLSVLGQGPIAWSVRLAEEMKRNEIASAKWEAEKAQMAEAAKIKPVQDVVSKVKQDRNEAAARLKSNLKGIIDRAQEAIDAIEAGHAPRPFGGILGTQMVSESEQQFGKLVALEDLYSKLSAMFGEGDDIWTTWPEADARAARIKAEAEAAS